MKKKGREEDLLFEERLVEEFEKRRKAIDKKKVKKEIKHFRMVDFFEIVIGVGVFGLPALINTSFWDYLKGIQLDQIMYVHLFFVICAVIATNFRFRSDIPLHDRVYMINFAKRVFFTYVSVIIVISVMLVQIQKIYMDMLMYDFLKNMFSALSVGLMGAVTFSFFKKDD